MCGCFGGLRKEGVFLIATDNGVVGIASDNHN